jgi:Protein of unknown function (DUF4245)
MSSPTPGRGRIVAELGRPETADETAARKAENSRAHRANQTTRNLILALLASLALVLFVVLVVVRPATNLVPTVHYKTVAAEAQQTVSQHLAVPELPESWSSNDAELKQGVGSATTWYVGFITPKQQFIALEQGINRSAGWPATVIGKVTSTGHVTIDGVRWTVYDQRSNANAGNFGYTLSATIGSSRYLLHGSADNAEFRTLATGVIDAANGD